jgi:putative membrane protein
MGTYEHGGFFMGGFMWLFWIALIVAVVFSVKSFSNQSGQNSTPDSPIEILRKRYARGEINKEDFERMKHELQNS